MFYCTILWNYETRTSRYILDYWFYNMVIFIIYFTMWCIDSRKILVNSCSLTLPSTHNARETKHIWFMLKPEVVCTFWEDNSDNIVKLGSRPCPGHVQVMLRSCSGHVQVISILSPSQISRSGPGADSIIAMPPPTTQQTFLSEITQISLQESKLKHKGRFRETSDDAHRHGQAKIT